MRFGNILLDLVIVFSFLERYAEEIESCKSI
jgi:hypothetical protein